MATTPPAPLHVFWIEGIRERFAAHTGEPAAVLFRLPVQAVSAEVARELAANLTPILAPGNGAATSLRISQRVIPSEALPELAPGSELAPDLG